MYSLELQITGIILFSAMSIGGFSIWLKRRKIQNNLEMENNSSL
jgi:hypothetical protein